MADIDLRLIADDSDVSGRLRAVESGLKDVQGALGKTERTGKKAFADVGKSIQDQEKHVKSFGGSLSEVSKIIGGILGADLIRFGARSARNLARAGMDAAQEYDRLDRIVTRLTDNAEDAARVLEDVAELSRSAPFPAKDIEETARTLLDFGTSANSLKQELADLSDIAAGSEKSLSEVAGMVTFIRANEEQIDRGLRRFARAGIDVTGELAKNFGVTREEITEMAKQGRITADDVTQAFRTMASAGGDFEDATEKLANTVEGQRQIIQNNFRAILQEFFTEFNPVIIELQEDFRRFLDQLDSESIRNFAGTVRDVIMFLVEKRKSIAAIAGAIITLNVGYTVLTRSIAIATAAKRAFLLLSGPFGLAVAAVTGLVAVLSQTIFQTSEAEKITKRYENSLADLSKQIDRTKSRTDQLFKTVTDLTKSDREREAALRNLKQLYPEVTSDIDLQTASLKDLEAAQRAVNAAIIDQAVAERQAAVQRDFADLFIEKQLKLKELQEDLNTVLEEGTSFSREYATAVATGRGVVGDLEFQIKKLKKEIEDAEKAQNETINRLNGVTDALTDQFGESTDQLNQFYDGAREAVEQFRDDHGKATDEFLKEKALRMDARMAELEMMEELTEAQQQEIANIEAVRAAITNELADRRKQAEARMEAAQKAAEEERKYIETIRREYENLFGQLESTQLNFELEGMTPADRIIREAELAGEAMQELEDELRKRAEILGKAFEFDDDFTEIQSQILLDRDKKLLELQLQQREEAISRRFDLEVRAAELIQDISEEGLSLEESRARRSIQIERQRLDELEKLREEQLQAIIADPSSDSAAVQAAQDAIEDIKITFQELDEEERRLNESINDRLEQESLQRINLRRDLALAEVELLQENTEAVLTLEQEKEKRRLEIQRQALIDQREVLLERFGPDSEEIQLLDAQIQLIEIRANEIGRSTDPFDFLRNALKDALQINDEELDALIGSVGMAINSIQGLFDQSLQMAIRNNEELLNELRDRRRTIEDELDAELREQEKGRANKVESKKLELEQIRAEEERAAQELEEMRERQAKREAIQNAASTVTQLVLAGARFFQEGAKLGPILGPILAATAIATMIGAIRSVKDAGASQIVSAFKGGPVESYLGTGRTDKNGRRGHRVEGTNLQLGLREFIMSEDPAQEHGKFLQLMNDGHFKNVDLMEMAKGARKMTGDFSPILMMDQAESATFSNSEEKVKREHDKMITEALSGNFDRLMKYFDNKPDYIPVSKEGYYEIKKGYIKKIKK